MAGLSRLHLVGHMAASLTCHPASNRSARCHATWPCLASLAFAWFGSLISRANDGSSQDDETGAYRLTVLLTVRNTQVLPNLSRLIIRFDPNDLD